MPLNEPFRTGAVSLALLTALTRCGSDSDFDRNTASREEHGFCGDTKSDLGGWITHPTSPLRDSPLPQAGLLIENCCPDLTGPTGYHVQDALVDGCVLTNYVPE